MRKFIDLPRRVAEPIEFATGLVKLPAACICRIRIRSFRSLVEFWTCAAVRTVPEYRPANQYNDENLFIIRNAQVAQHFRVEVDRVFSRLAADFA